MALTRPLKLRAEVVHPRRNTSDSETNAVKVWVDSGVFHLDSEFEYSIPENLDDSVTIGVRVVVPFGGRECEAIVINRCVPTQAGPLKQILKVLSPHSVATTDSLTLIAHVAKRWCAHPYDVIRSAIPPRVATVDKEWKRPTFEGNRTKHVFAKDFRNYYQLPAQRSLFKLMQTIFRKRFRKRSIPLSA